MLHLRSNILNAQTKGSRCLFAVNAIAPLEASRFLSSESVTSLVSCFPNETRRKRNTINLIPYTNVPCFPCFVNHKPHKVLRRYNHNSNYVKQRKQKMQESMEQDNELYHKLLNKSNLFLQNYDKITSVAKKMKEIQQLVYQWNTMWGSTPSSSSSTSSTNNIFSNFRNKPKLPKKNEDYEVSTNNTLHKKSNITLEGVKIVDQLAHKLLDEIEYMIDQNKTISSPPHIILNFAIGGWSKAPPSEYNGIKAQELLERMDYIHEKLDNSISFNIQSTTICYGAAIGAWSNTIDDEDSDRNGAKMAEKLLKKMETKYFSEKNNDAKPNLIVYNTCLHAYAQRGMIYEAEALIEKLELSDDDELIPDVYTYSICMNAYEKFRGSIKEGLPVEKRAEELLMKMIKKYENTGNRRFMPNQFTVGTGEVFRLHVSYFTLGSYTNNFLVYDKHQVLSILSNSQSKDGANEAYRILRWLVDFYEKESHKSQSPLSGEGDKQSYPVLRPTIGHFMTVFLAFSKRQNVNLACQRIAELLIEIQRLNDAGLSGFQPNYQVR